MKKYKYIVSMIVMLFMCFTASKVVSAEEFTKTYTTGELTSEVKYLINDENTVTLKNYNGPSDQIVGIKIPEAVEYNGKLYIVTALGDNAFYVDSNLGYVEIPKTVKSIGEKCFYYCSNLQKVSFAGDGLQKIGANAFFGCNLQSFDFPSTVTEVGRVAFGYASFTSITIPKSVTKWGDGMFYGSSRLTSVVFEEGTTVVPDGMFSGCEKISKVKLSSTITKIEDSAFSHGGTIEELTLPKSLTEIQDYAFYTTKIKKLIVECDNVKIGSQALYSIGELYCTKNSTVYDEFKNRSNVKIILTGTYMEQEELALKTGEMKNLTVTNPSGVTTWSSSNPAVAEVDASGNVTGKAGGTATISAVNNGVTMQCKVTVAEYKISKASQTLGEGAVIQLKTSAGGKVEWTSSNKKVAVVDAKGLVTAKKTGKATITATCAGQSVKCAVVVKANERKLEKYSRNVSKYPKNIAGFGFGKIKRDSKGNYVLMGHLLNNYSKKGSYVKNMTITLYKDGKKIARQKFSKFKVKAPAHKFTAIKITIQKKNISKKTTDLRTGKITVKVSGGTLY